MHTRSRLLGLGLFALTPCAIVPAATPAFPARQTLTAGEYQIEYTEGDEAFAQDFAARAPEIFQIAPLEMPPAIELSLAELKQHRDEYLASICRYLHVAKATPQMSKVYDISVEMFERGHAHLQKIQASSKRIQLWRGHALKARLEAGQSIPGIKVSADGNGVDFSSPANSPDFSNWALPVLIRSRDTETGTALVDKKIGEAHVFWKMVVQLQPGRQAVHTIFHETVEIALIDNYLPSQDRRWFCEGVANYVGYKIIEDKLGAAIARQYYNIDEQIAQYADLRSTIRLEQWASLEAQQKENHDDRKTRQGMANYAYATEVIFKVAAKHGPDFLPRLLGEVGKTPRRKTSIKTVYRAFKKLHQEDLRGYLPAHN